MNPEEKSSETKIKIVQSYFKMLVIAVFVAIFAYKLCTATWEVDMSKFDFNTLLSLILAIFSIVLSVMFYFKATDTSNTFYDNTYKFTRDISEILGRIEAGFGERLKHLDEGYSGLWDKFTIHSPSEDGLKIQNTTKEIELEKAKLEQQMSEKEQILDNLLSLAKIDSEEKASILEKLGAKEEIISNLKSELNLLKKRLEKEESNSEWDASNYQNILTMISDIIIDRLGVNSVIEESDVAISSRFRSKVLPI